MSHLEQQFNKLYQDVLIFLEETEVKPKDVCFILSEQEQWKRNQHYLQYLREAVNALANSENVMAIYLVLNTYCNLLNSEPLGHITSYYYNSLVNEASRKEAERLYAEYKIYESNLKWYMNFTTVELFCKFHEYATDIPTPPQLVEIISKHSWNQPVYLETVDKFRRSLADHQNTPTLAAVIVGLSISSIRIFVPTVHMEIWTSESVTFFEENDIVELQIQGSVVYRQVNIHQHSSSCF